MKKIKISLIILLFALSFSTFAQSKVAHINTTELVASMPEMNDAKAELEKLAKTYETDIQTMAAELQSKVKLKTRCSKVFLTKIQGMPFSQVHREEKP